MENWNFRVSKNWKIGILECLKIGKFDILECLETESKVKTLEEQLTD